MLSVKLAEGLIVNTSLAALSVGALRGTKTVPVASLYNLICAVVTVSALTAPLKVTV